MKIVVNNIKSKTKDNEFNLYIYNKVYGKIFGCTDAKDTQELCKKSGDANVYGKAKIKSSRPL